MTAAVRRRREGRCLRQGSSRPSTRPPEGRRSRWRHRHLLDVDGLSTGPSIELVMRTADAMREVMARPIAKVPALRGRA